jgi:hypothetical protein
MLLNTHSERRERNNEKIRILLNFLKEETYSDLATFMLLYQFKERRPLYRLSIK